MIILLKILNNIVIVYLFIGYIAPFVYIKIDINFGHHSINLILKKNCFIILMTLHKKTT